ncbi:MAG TPA: S-layer homology domain-containing protein, partial [Chloroflexia bacterium]|nr:S-layer homology domain-containing protein [Chloroflexia bacterium]
VYGSRTITLHWDGIQWTRVPSPNPEVNGLNHLGAVVAISTNDVWALGNHTYYDTLALHWDGMQWNVVPSPRVFYPSGRNICCAFITSADGATSNDIWAVGGYNLEDHIYSFTMHWDGTQWSLHSLPRTASDEYTMKVDGVTFVAANNVWAIGAGADFTDGDFIAIFRWNGTAWTVAYRQNISAPSFLTDIEAVSANDIWAASSGLLLHWNGSQWSAVSGPAGGVPYGYPSVAARAANDVWVIYSSTDDPPGPDRAIHWDGATWSSMTISNVTNPRLNDVVAISPTEVWAVGSINPEGEFVAQPLTMRWDGSSWQIIPTPSLRGATNNTLRGIAAFSANNAWAVGTYHNNARGRTLVQHWNGSRWTVVPSPNVEEPPAFYSSNYLYSIDGASPTDIWAVGYSSNLGTAGTGEYIASTLIEHWNGSQWQVVPSPNVAGNGGTQLNNYLADTSVLSTTYAWAVGYYDTTDYQQRALALRWDGAQWSIVPTPPLTMSHSLTSVSAVSPSDAWAVGSYIAGNGESQALVWHWNGTQWSEVVRPNLGTAHSFFKAVSARSANDVWAVGYHGTGNSSQTLVMHWNGTQWSVVPSPNPSEDSYLWDVEAVGANDAWAVGNYLAGGVLRTLAVHWNGQQWSMANTANVNQESNYLWGVAVASADEVWAVGEYRVEEIPQTLTHHFLPPTFKDVPATNTFYPYVTCLACKGADTGYACGGPGEPCDASHTPYYRPNTPIKRDNIARIVAISAGFSEPAGAQVFQDVPPTDPSYEWIQRMAHRGLIGGYPCGTTSSEPCVAPNNRPYYRPSANATRGQIAKIVSNGAGFNEPHTTRTYEDVPTNHAFYIWIERLTSRYVMGGYPCGGAFEPCGAGNRPYFRWGADATRGQTTKIASNTFFPSCSP